MEECLECRSCRASRLGAVQIWTKKQWPARKASEAKVSSAVTTNGTSRSSTRDCCASRRVIKCQFAGSLGWTGFHPSDTWRIFRDLAPENREKIIQDNNMSWFCLRHGADQDYFGWGTDRKLACQVPECARKLSSGYMMTKERSQ
jgi:hypothetical protein